MNERNFDNVCILKYSQEKNINIKRKERNNVTYELSTNIRKRGLKRKVANYDEYKNCDIMSENKNN